MFGLFTGKSQRYGKVPDWANYFNLEEFNDFISNIEQNFKNQKINIDIGRGVMEVAEIFGKDSPLGLSNLASICHQSKKNEWKNVISDHFNNALKADIDGKELKGKIENFQAISKYLALRIWPKNCLDGGIKPIFREDIEDLITVLVMDLPTAVQTVKFEEVQKWNKSLDELFDIGKENVLKNYPVRIDRQMINEKPCYLFHGEHFFVSIHAFILEKYPECIGRYGTIVSFPHRHVLLIYPISGKDIIKSLNNLMAAAAGMYKEGMGPISPNVYWYMAGSFTKLPYEVNNGNLRFSPPQSFIDLLEQIVKAQI